MSKLTVKQRKFADNYIKSGNATESYIKAGYSVKTRNIAEVEGCKLLRNPKVANYVEDNMNKLSNNKIATAEEVLEYLTRVARGEEKEQEAVYNSNAGKVELVDVTPALRERTKAAELLGKRYAIFTDKKEIDVNVNKSLEDFFESDV